MNNMITATSADTFESDVLTSDVPVLVDFWAEWCAPCRSISPILDEVAIDYQGKVKIVKVDVDQNSGLTEKYGVRGIPALLLFKDGEMVGNSVGALTKAQLLTFLDQHCS